MTPREDWASGLSTSLPTAISPQAVSRVLDANAATALQLLCQVSKCVFNLCGRPVVKGSAKGKALFPDCRWHGLGSVAVLLFAYQRASIALAIDCELWKCAYTKANFARRNHGGFQIPRGLDNDPLDFMEVRYRQRALAVLSRPPHPVYLTVRRSLRHARRRATRMSKPSPIRTTQAPPTVAVRLHAYDRTPGRDRW